MSNVHFLEGQCQFSGRNLTHVLLSFFALNSAVDRNEPVVKEEVIRRLKFFVNTVQDVTRMLQWNPSTHGGL
jgi:hypothetical protein